MSLEATLERRCARDDAPRTRSLALPGGLRLNALHWPRAEAAGPAVVLVHGLADTAWVWDAVASALAQRADVFAIELRGHGCSDRGPAGGYDRPTMAADLAAAIDVLALDRPHLVGHSLGAAVALHAAAQAPQRFAGIALLDYATEVPAATLALVRGVIERMQDTYARVEDYAQLLRRRHPLAPAELVERIARGALAPAVGGFRQRFDIEVLRALSVEQDVAAGALLSRLALPVQFVRGALSWMVSEQAARGLAEACPGARSAVVPMAGHSVQIDNPAGTLDVLESFLAASGTAR
jgi:pimeloyl-ACP methyl ester carboxylesterase